MKMKLGTVLIFCVLVVQKEAVRADQYEENDDKSVSNGTESESKGGQNASFVKFSGDLYQAVKESQPQNFIFSPLSVRNALAMLSLGAMGETAEEFQKVLQLPADASDLINEQSNLISSLKSISSPSLGLRFATGDAVFTNAKIRVKQEFKDHVTRLGGETERFNFGNGETVATKINAWVQNKTEKKIGKIVEPADLNDQIFLLVLNTIYFKGAWKNKFNVSETTQSPFFINGSCSMNVDMMTQKSEFQFADIAEANAQVILLPYKGERLGMMIYVPWKKEDGALGTLENWLKDQSPFDIQEQILDDPAKISIFIPRFKIRSSLNLNEPLKTLGLEKMFDATVGNFSGIFNDSRNFAVSKVSQQTFIEVTEKGTEAAAVTGSELSATSAGSVFRADRPFLFQIVDSETKTILFSGRVKNPLDGTVVSGSDSDSEDGGPRCIGVKSKVEELLLDFANFLAPNKTEPHNITTRAARLQVFLEKHENKTAGAMEFIQLLDSTLNKLERTEEESGNKTRSIEALKEKEGNLERVKEQLENRVSSQNQTINGLQEEKQNTLTALRKKEEAEENKARRIKFLEENELRLEKSVKGWENMTISQREDLDWVKGQMRNLSETLAQKIASCPPKDPLPSTPATTERTTTERATIGFPGPKRGSSQNPVTRKRIAQPPQTTTENVSNQEEEQSRPVGVSAARVYECGNYWCEFTKEPQQYDATRDRDCKTSYYGIKSVQLTGSCVTLYQWANCSGEQFKLNTENAEQGRDVQKVFPYQAYGQTNYHRPRSIGPCSQWINE